MKHKHPRTYHLPWSEEVHGDDKVLKSTAHFDGEEVVVTEKRDGENTSLYHNGYIHARKTVLPNQNPSGSFSFPGWIV